MLNLLGVLKCVSRGHLYQVQGYYALPHGSCHLILTDAFLIQKDLTKGTDTSSNTASQVFIPALSHYLTRA